LPQTILLICAMDFNRCPDWGANSYSDTRRRPLGNRAKAHHQNGKRSPQQQPMAPWSPECSPLPSPQWQPQSPPPTSADAGYTGFQETQGPVAVNLQGLPPTLCRQPFLEAMLDQAGLADDIMGCVLGEDLETGTAVIYVSNYNAAVKCVQHFGGRRWDHAGTAVKAQVAEVRCPPSPSAPAMKSPTMGPAGGHRAQPQGHKNTPEQMMMMVPASPLMPIFCPPSPGSWAMPPPVMALPVRAVQDMFPQTAGGDSPKTAGSDGSGSPKTRWADLADEEHSKEPLSEGQEGSTSADSKDFLGENQIFGCDVDTDDGF